MLYQITARHFVAGFEITDGRVSRAAPIIKYMVGWDVLKVKEYCMRKGWRVQHVSQSPSTE